MKNLTDNPIYICIGLTFILCILKTFGIISWSWVWCTILVWFPLFIVALCAFILMTALFLYILYAIGSVIYDKLRRRN